MLTARISVFSLRRRYERIEQRFGESVGRYAKPVASAHLSAERGPPLFPIFAVGAQYVDFALDAVDDPALVEIRYCAFATTHKPRASRRTWALKEKPCFLSSEAS